MLGAACITGVPAFGLPKISSLVGGIFMPRFFSFAAVINQRKQSHAFCRKDATQLFHCLSTESFAGQIDDPGCAH